MMITLVSSPKQHLPKDMQHSVHIGKFKCLSTFKSVASKTAISLKNWVKRYIHNFDSITSPFKAYLKIDVLDSTPILRPSVHSSNV